MSDLPKQIGQYQIQRVIGSGGMATVYAALQKQPRRTVAIKVLNSEIVSESTLRRFRREIEILGRLRHPCIASVYEAGTYEDESGIAHQYLAVEYVPAAKTILEFAHNQRLDIKDRLKLFIKICSAVEHAHKQRVIHRDLKPNNILIDTAGRLKLIDFGVAHAADPELGELTVEKDTGQLLGTIQYMSPEQVEASPSNIDPRSDVYALGIVLYELLTDQHPYDLKGLRIHEALRVILTRPPRPPSQISPEVKGDLEAIILSALEKDRSRRYADAGAFGRDILRFLKHQPIQAKKAGAVHKARLFAKRRSRLLVATSVIASLLIAVATFAVWKIRQAKQEVQVAQQHVADAKSIKTLQNEAKQTVQTSDQDKRSYFILPGKGEPLDALIFDPKGESLLLVSTDQPVTAWDLNKREKTLTFSDNDAAVSQLLLSGSGEVLAIIDDDGQVVQIDVSTGDVISRRNYCNGELVCLALNENASQIAVGCDDLTIGLFSDQNSELIHTLRSSSGAFVAVTFNKNASLIAALSDTNTIYQWQTSTGNRLWSFVGLEDTVAISFESTTNYLWCVSLTKGAIGIDIKTGDAKQKLSLGREDLTSAVFDTSGRYLATIVDDRTVRVWDVIEKKLISTPITTNNPIARAALSPQGLWIALASENGDIEVFPVFHLSDEN